jgi:predicted AAA+ superfamily ATPase
MNVTIILGPQGSGKTHLVRRLYNKNTILFEDCGDLDLVKNILKDPLYYDNDYFEIELIFISNTFTKKDFKKIKDCTIIELTRNN